MALQKNSLTALLLVSCLTTFFSSVTCQDCLPTQFRCNTGVCLSQSNVCNGVNDCSDGSDETRDLCVKNGTCVNGMFMCNSNPDASPPYCIQNSSLCNGIQDCAHGEDEATSLCNNQCRNGGFHCTKSYCIPWEHVCDGVSDCDSGLDESNCTATLCPNPSFNCSYGTCIPADLMCNGYWDCRDGSDELQSLCNPNVTCGSDELYCMTNLVGQKCIKIQNFCSGMTDCPSAPYSQSDCGVDMCVRDHPCGSGSFCRTRTLGYECYCPIGYTLGADKISCRDIDECTVTPQVCSQYCTNTDGSYICTCETGFTATSVLGECLRTDTSVNPILLFGHKYYISSINLDGSEYESFAINLTFAHVIDFDWQSQRLYHFDVTLKSLHYMNINGNNDVVVDRLHSSSVEGIAIDWIHRKILWTSTQLMGIYISELDGNFVTPVVKGVSTNCRGIAVHPQYNIVLWTDWGWEPFIASIGMDGSQMVKIITTDLFWPNGLTLDYILNRFWWVDALLDRISYANIDGSNRHVMLSKSLSHPYGITQFDSQIFWTDWNYKSLNVTNRMTGVYQRPLLSNLPIMPYDIKAFHPARQPSLPGSNPCADNNGGCTHLCLPSPTVDAGYVCACPQGKPLNPDQMSCNVTCSVSQFTCNDGTCIPWFYKCNGQLNCRGGEDEPATCGYRNCSASLFQCANDTYSCISQTNVCDLVPQCADRSDEDPMMCGNRACMVWEFLCPSTGRCIPLSWVCDQTIDCALSEDEAPVNPQCVEVACKSDEFKCNNSKCIPNSYYCDVDDDCGDRSDEPDTCWVYRSNNPCRSGYKRCPKNYRCIPTISFCDGLNDCRDGTDELPENCLPCNTGEFTCQNKRCIPLRWVCDFNNDCGDNSDENATMCNPLYRNCTDVEFRCSDGKCVHEHLRCDGNPDCTDGSDEVGCGGCPSDMFQCQGGVCITSLKHCDGHKDCPDGSDELACPTRYPDGRYCREDQFTCNNTVCIEFLSVCDTVNDCGDDSDETPASCDLLVCPPGMYQCATIRNCIPATQVCDGVKQCSFGDDESNCANCEATHLFKCNSTGVCIDNSLVCDYKYDCSDGSDESGCLLSDCRQCQQNCTVVVSTNKQVICSCWSGYIINPKDTRTCIERDDCGSLAYNWCPHACLKQKSGNSTFRCLCAEGFSDLNGDGRTCIPNDGLRGGLLYGLGNRVVLRNLTTNEVIEVNELLLNTNPGGEVYAVDADSRKGIAYWMDDLNLFRAAIPKDDTQMAFEQKIMQVSVATGLSYDWITGNIYWCDNDGIYVTSQNIYWLKTTIWKNASDAFRPSRVIVNPSTGKMFFINNYFLKPEILSMDMNGNNLVSIISQNLLYPSDLALDLNLGNRLFWTDAGQNIIESSRPDGSDRTIHLRDDSHPFRLDVFAGRLYWTTTDRDQLKVADGLGQGVKTVFLSQQMQLGPLRYVQALSYNMYTINKCDGYGCTFCLLSSSEPRCMCPDGYFFKTGSIYECDISPPPGYVPLGDPTLCVCRNNGVCQVQNGTAKCVCRPGFTGPACEFILGSATPTVSTVSLRTTPPVKSSSPFQTPITATEAAQSSPTSPSSESVASASVASASIASASVASSSSGVVPTTSSTVTSEISQALSTTTTKHTETSTTAPPVVGKTGKDNKALKIALPVVLLSVLFILLIIALCCCCCRRRQKRSNAYGLHIDDASSVSSYPSTPTSPREPVAFNGGSVQFGENLAYTNPMYKDMAMVLDPPPYSPPHDKLEKRDPDLDAGYNQPEKDNILNAGYNQLKPLEITTLPMTNHSDA